MVAKKNVIKKLSVPKRFLGNEPEDITRDEMVSRYTLWPSAVDYRFMNSGGIISIHLISPASNDEDSKINFKTDSKRRFAVPKW